MRRFSPSRTSGWSSTMRMRSFVTLAMSGAIGVGNRDAHRDGGSEPGRGFDGQFAADQRRALAHADEPKRRYGFGREVVDREPAPVILDHEDDPVVASFEEDADMRRARMLVDVVQRLLCETIQIRFDIRPQPYSIDPDGVAVGAYVKTLRPASDQARQRRRQPQVIEGGWPEFPGQEVDAAVQFLGQAHRAFDRLGTRRVDIGPLLQLFQVDADSGHLLAELIVDVARDAAPLVFLCGHQSREQRLDFVLCRAPYADFDLKRPIRSREFRRSFADSLLQGVIQPAQPLLGLAQLLVEILDLPAA